MLALRRLQQFLCTQDKSRLSCFAEWKLWWNLIHKLYLCIMVKDGSGEDLQTKAGSSFSRHIAVWCLWVVICARVSKKRQAAYTAQLGLCLHYVVPDWWCYEIEVTHPHVLALGITFCVEPWEGLFHAARRHFSHAQTGMHTHICTQACIHTPLCTLLNSSISDLEIWVQRVLKAEIIFELLQSRFIWICHAHIEYLKSGH